MKGSKLSKEAHDTIFGGDTIIHQIQGNAGDVMLTHPFLLHARSKNLGQRGIDSVRFMCNPNVALYNKMKLKDSLSPVEKSIVMAITTDDPATTNSNTK